MSSSPEVYNVGGLRVVANANVPRTTSERIPFAEAWRSRPWKPWRLCRRVPLWVQVVEPASKAELDALRRAGDDPGDWKGAVVLTHPDNLARLIEDVRKEALS